LAYIPLENNCIIHGFAKTAENEKAALLQAASSTLIPYPIFEG
jgi:hypothetical protein